MNIDVRVVDIRGRIPDDPKELSHVMIKREISDGHLATHALPPAAGQPYRILQNAMDAAELDWSLDKAGTHVAVPLRPYVVTDAPESLVKFGLQLGALAAASAVNADRIVLLVSTVFQRPDNQPGYCVYAGVAYRQER